jgi:hypothetical protein
MIETGENLPRVKHGRMKAHYDGDQGPTECTLDYDGWCRLTGFDPDLRQYSRPSQPVAECFILTTQRPRVDGFANNGLQT